ncbi:MAG: hypothetical protein ABI777_12905 [Betaproteobacteria bacterium]
MKKFLQAVGLVTIVAATSWAVQRWLGRSTAICRATPCEPDETWESEGGALAPLPGGQETSQVPR